MTIDVFAICFNEQFLLPHFIAHYKAMGANITIYDNCSTDNSKQIIKDAGCTLMTYDSGGQIRDDLYLGIKNEVWKRSKAEWVIICDLDEFLEINFDISKYNIIRTQGYDMIGAPPSQLGCANNMYSKYVMFRPDAFTQIGYQPGCHSINPTPNGQVLLSKETAKLLHYKYISEDYVYNRHVLYQVRLSDFNKQYGFGVEYQSVERDKIDQKFVELRAKCLTVPK